MGWNDGHKKYYFADSSENELMQFDCILDRREIKNKQIIFKSSEGFPDGMIIDSDNNLWIATFYWNVVKVYPSNPNVIAVVVELPVEQEEDGNDPSNIMLIDWQIIKEGPVVLDLSYFFYTVASKEELKKLKYYMGIYHQELSQWINKLGSDADVLYPYSVFEAEWKTHCRYAYTLATIVFKVMLVDKEDAVDFEKMIENNQDLDVNMGPEYFNRLRNLTEHFVQHGFI